MVEPFTVDGTFRAGGVIPVEVGDVFTMEGQYQPVPWVLRAWFWLRGEAQPKVLKRFVVIGVTSSYDPPKACDHKTDTQIKNFIAPGVSAFTIKNG